MPLPQSAPPTESSAPTPAASARQPRRWLSDPKQFGKRRVQWNAPPASATVEEDLAYEAARAQHLVALHVRTEARRQQLTLADIAEVTTFPNGHRHLGAVLRGEFPLTFRHLIALQAYFVDVAAFGDEVRRQPAPPPRAALPHGR